MINVYAKAFVLNVQRPSNRWVQLFKQRYVFLWQKNHRKSGDAQMQNIQKQLEHIRKKIAAYALKMIFNFDETALQPSHASDTTIAHHQIEGKSH